MSSPVPSTRERVLREAADLTGRVGWARVTMARLAEEVGVSRQTVYNEVGSRPQLAEAMVLRELDLFLALVTAAFDAHPEDLRAALRAASLAVLEAAEDNPLLHAVVSATSGADTELLPLLTTHSAPLLGAAQAIVVERASAYPLGLDATRLATAIDLLVRLVLSHIMQPAGPPAATADDIVWLVGHVLD